MRTLIGGTTMLASGPLPAWGLCFESIVPRRVDRRVGVEAMLVSVGGTDVVDLVSELLCVNVGALRGDVGTDVSSGELGLLPLATVPAVDAWFSRSDVGIGLTVTECNAEKETELCGKRGDLISDPFDDRRDAEPPLIRSVATRNCPLSRSITVLELFPLPLGWKNMPAG